jgi:DNA modification methylase
MTQINLTEEEKLQIIEALNQGIEPSIDLLPKIFPRTAEKFDVVALDRAKIPTLEYAGKRTKAAILAEGDAGIGAAPLQVVRSFDDVSENDWRNLIVQGDNLQFLKTCYKNTDPLIKGKVKGKVKLIYIDPPFATKSDFGGKDGEYSYGDKVDRARFLETLRERLIYLKEILAEDGSIFLHLDQKMSHYVKITMDEVFGKDCFVNEIIWRYRRWPTKTPAFQKMHDTIFWYRKTEKNILWNQLYEELAQSTIETWGTKKQIADFSQGHRKPSQTDEDSSGAPMSDVWEISVIAPIGKERTGYPTQKPEELLRRIILSCTEVNDLVMDCFAGSGTTAAVAEKLERRWVSCDFGKHAIYTMQKRMLRIKESKKLGNKDIDETPRCAVCHSVLAESDTFKKCKNCGSFHEKEEKTNKEKYGVDPRPFCIISSGAYDFSHIMDMRKNKDSYIDFALGLFQLARDDDKAAKFKIPNIYGLKENNPVEVYPVWDDSYLKEIRIDEVYLQGILAHTAGRLRGDYYIITPESCTNISDTILKNQEGKDVNFKILTFPYKILEDVSQKLKLEDQPSSSKSINNLITSTSFYFNEDIQISVERVKEGLKITKFDTKILNGEGNRFEGFSGLAMILVDLDFNSNKPFDMDFAVYADKIDESGFFEVGSLTEKVGIIAIDKHGNESKPLEIK